MVLPKADSRKRCRSPDQAPAVEQVLTEQEPAVEQVLPEQEPAVEQVLPEQEPAFDGSVPAVEDAESAVEGAVVEQQLGLNQGEEEVNQPPAPAIGPPSDEGVVFEFHQVPPEPLFGPPWPQGGLLEVVFVPPGMVQAEPHVLEDGLIFEDLDFLLDGIVMENEPVAGEGLVEQQLNIEVLEENALAVDQPEVILNFRGLEVTFPAELGQLAINLSPRIFDYIRDNFEAAPAINEDQVIIAHLGLSVVFPEVLAPLAAELTPAIQNYIQDNFGVQNDVVVAGE